MKGALVSMDVIKQIFCKRRIIHMEKKEQVMIYINQYLSLLALIIMVRAVEIAVSFYPLFACVMARKSVIVFFVGFVFAALKWVAMGCIHSMKNENCCNANFFTTRCRWDNLRCHPWIHMWHYNNYCFSQLAPLSSAKSTHRWVISRKT